MQNLDKIRLVSRWMWLACNIALMCLPLFMIWVWLDFERFAPFIGHTLGLPLQREYLGPLNLLLGFLCSLIPVSVILVGIWRLRQMFHNYQHGILFSQSNADHLLIFARMLFISVLLTPISSALLSVALTFSNPPGQRSLVLSLGSYQFATLFLAGVFMAVAWIMREGHRLANENAGFV